MLHIVQFAGTVAAGLFTGGTLFSAIVEHPARIQAGVPAAVAQFGPSFRRATYLDVFAAGVTLVLCGTATALGASFLWLLGGLLVGIAIPLTVTMIVPTGRQLVAAEASADESEVEALLHRWGRLHELRTFFAVAGFIVVAAAA